MKRCCPGIGVRHVKRKITGIRIALTTLVYALHKNTLSLYYTSHKHLNKDINGRCRPWELTLKGQPCKLAQKLQ